MTCPGIGLQILKTDVNKIQDKAINPDAQYALYKLGYEWGQSRVIAGFLWQGDVDASCLLAAACYSRLHTEGQILPIPSKIMRQMLGGQDKSDRELVGEEFYDEEWAEPMPEDFEDEE